ncbi:MAG TPA: hypothetical protein PLV21_06605 [Cyclobacteriaceae bacterium]|nr:hypothetical protein [Cyclobacteriaceae bacterium]HRJ81533.1 hypothetical protein [Cyclobacteriaceae bacterium]
MIAIHILVKNTTEARVIAEELFQRKLTTKGIVIENAMLLEQDLATELYGVMLITLTKANHYNEVLAILQQLFPKEIPNMYALPIINTNIQ